MDRWVSIWVMLFMKKKSHLHCDGRPLRAARSSPRPAAPPRYYLLRPRPTNTKPTCLMDLFQALH